MNRMSSTKPLMIQGTASSSGKSLITAALCRILHEDGVKVAPFKAQNMSNNSFVTHDGYEMGRAQVVQAYAAGLAPDVRMNPVLIKPSSDTGAQVVVHGKPSFFMNASSWHETRERLRTEIGKAYRSLAGQYPCIVIEGAGSPAEINLKENDVVNMGMAAMADAPVLIVGDIDRGGVFASLVGTVMLLDDEERSRVKGFIINKFRGEESLLTPGLRQLETITGIPVLGVIPWIHHAIDEEDGQSEWFDRSDIRSGHSDICILRLPHISNFTDFIPLENIPGVRVRWCDRPETFGTPDLLILPGTKATVNDLLTLRSAGIADVITAYAEQGGAVLGICGGFQMLGTTLRDPFCVESNCTEVPGLGFLDMETEFSVEKRTKQVSVTLSGTGTVFSKDHGDGVIDGYEIHMGESVFGERTIPFTCAVEENGNLRCNGIADRNGTVAGTYCHGLFDSGRAVKDLIDTLRLKKGLDAIPDDLLDRKLVLEKSIRHLADICRDHLDMQRIKEIIG